MKVNGLKVVYSGCQGSDYWNQEGKYAPVSRVLTLLKQPVNQSSARINGSRINTSWQTSKKSKLKEISVSEKLPCRRISKGKSQSAQNTTHPGNPIYKVTMMKIYPMNIWLQDPPTLLGWNLIRSISISTNPCREALIQSIIRSSGLVLNLKPNWPPSQPQGYSKKMGEIYPSIGSDIKVMR